MGTLRLACAVAALVGWAAAAPTGSIIHEMPDVDEEEEEEQEGGPMGGAEMYYAGGDDLAYGADMGADMGGYYGSPYSEMDMEQQLQSVGALFAKLDGVQYNSFAELRAGVTGKWANLEAHSIHGEPSFVDSTNPVLANRDYRLASDSLGIDSAVAIPWFNDSSSAWPFAGTAPDMGAFESY